MSSSPISKPSMLSSLNPIATLWGSIVISMGLLGLLIGTAAAALVPPRLAVWTNVLPFAGLIAAELALVLALRPRWLYLLLLFATILEFETVEDIYVPLGFMKLYLYDVVFLFNVFLICARTFLRRTQFRRIPYNWIVVAYFVLGIFSLFYGWLIEKNPYDRAFGDFRRSFFYFMNYFVTLYLIDSFKDAKIFFKTLLIGAIVLIGKGLYQTGTGQFYFRRAGDAAHILSHIELTFLSLAVFYGAARLIFDPHARRWLWTLVVAVGGLVTVIGNYRAAWLGLAAGLLLIFLFLPAKRRLQVSLVMAGTLVVAALTVYALWDTDIGYHSTLGEQIAAKANVGQTTLDVNVIWRFQSYEAAIQEWRSTPWFGTGLGKSLEFYTVTSTGQSLLAFDHRVHNSFLYLFMSLGLLGFPIALSVHLLYFVISLRFLRRTNWLEGKILVLSLASFYASMMVATLFEHFLETTSTVTVLATSMGITMVTIYYGLQKHRETPSASTSASSHTLMSGT